MQTSHLSPLYTFTSLVLFPESFAVSTGLYRTSSNWRKNSTLSSRLLFCLQRTTRRPIYLAPWFPRLTRMSSSCSQEAIFPMNHQGDVPEVSIDSAVYGSYHVVFPLCFHNGQRRAIKIPIDGVKERWSELSKSALTSEAETIRLLRRETAIPIPEVYDFSATTYNPLHCTYIIKPFVTGTRLYDVWFGHRLKGISLEDNHRHRVRALTDIAFAMAQLGKFSL